MRAFPAFAILLLAFAGVAAAQGSPAGAARAAEEKDKYLLANEHVQLWLTGKAPVLRVLPGNATDANASGAFTYTFQQVVEYRDLDANGAPSPNEIVASLPLDAPQGWKANVTNASAASSINMTLTSDVRLAVADVPNVPVSLPADRSATVSLLFTLRGADQDVALGALNATVQATSATVGFAVEKWPFVDAANDRLALTTLATGSVKSANFTGLQRAVVSSPDGRALGALAWTLTAQGKTSAGASLPVPVKTDVAPVTDPTGTATGTSRLAFTFDAPALASVKHDSTVGLFPVEVAMPSSASVGAESLKPSPSVGLVGAVGIAAVAALALRRRD